MNLRPYQNQAVENLRAEIRSGNRHPVLVAPTGAGKTVIAANVVRSAVERGTRVIFLAHRRELINQCSGKLGDNDISHGVLMAKHPRTDPAQLVQVASVQTLVRRLGKNPHAPGLIIVDECHRTIAASYQKILDAYPGAVVLGLTATPERSDGRGLDQIYDSLVQVATVGELTGQGYLVPAKVYAPATPDLIEIKIKRGDYDDSALADLLDRPDLIGNIPRHWKQLAEGRTTVCFAVNIRHSQHIRDSFLAEGVRAEHVDGTTPGNERDAILKRLATGETQVVCNVGILTEGWDLPRASCCILARPTKSQGLYLQMVGRVLRTHQGKQDALVLDHAGCVHEHGLPDEDRAWTLDGRKDRAGKGGNGFSIRICKQCFLAIKPGVPICPACGDVLPVRSREIAEEDGQLAEVQRKPKTPGASDAVVTSTAQRLKRIAAERGYKRGWVWHRLRISFGEHRATEAVRRVAA